MSVIYLDNASTSWPKPPAVLEETARFLREDAANPGRGAHAMAHAAAAVVDRARRALARLVGAPNPTRVVFTHNATDAINLALKGLVGPGDRILTSSLEHNAVVRPVASLRGRRGVLWEVVPSGADGTIDLDALDACLQARPTRLIAISHASNVSGAIQPIGEVARRAHRHGARILVDAAQTAGVVPIDVAADEIDLLAVSGHKGLLGPTGTGALVIGTDLERELTTVREGGTGSRSEDYDQPRELPERFEAGTVNAVGLAGLAAGLAWLEERGVAALGADEDALGERLAAGLGAIDGVAVLGRDGPAPSAGRVGVVSFTVAGFDPQEVAGILDERFSIASRAGLHCAPLAHRTLGTFPAGTVRLSVGPFTTEAEVDAAVAAVGEIAPEAL